MPIGKISVIKQYFSTPERPVITQELVELRKDDKKSFDELAKLCAEALGEELIEPKGAV